MHVGNEHLALIRQRPQERRLLAIAGIDPHPAKAPPLSPRRADHVQSMPALRLQLPGRFRNAGSRTPRPILDPCLGKIKSHVDRRVPLPVRQHAKHRNLAVVDLAEPARPLPLNPNRTHALLEEARLVDDQAAVRPTAEKMVRIPANLRHNRLMLPWRVADEVLELLGTPVFHHGRHRLERAGRGLRQPLQIAMSHSRTVPRARRKETAVALNQQPECIRDPLNQRSRKHADANTVT